MNILIIGSGGREHALGWKLAQSPTVAGLYFAPGNAGTALIGTNIALGSDDTVDLGKYALDHNIGLTVVGPEAALADGIVDHFQKMNLNIFGPTQAASQLESSKAFAAKFMKRNGIPSPKFEIFYNVDSALDFITDAPWPYVIKADGLAAGKGVVIPHDAQQAKQTVIEMMDQGIFGDAGRTLVFQEKLIGQEVSLMAFSDGTTVVPLLPAQDHKRIRDNDDGPNTGVMGAYSPAPIMTAELLEVAQQTILEQTIDSMKREGHPYKGVLYAGLMMTKTGPKVLEYNVRFGDPETQPLMMMLKSDLAPILLSCIQGTLKSDQVLFKPGASVCVVLAAPGYPGKPQTGQIINGLQTVTNTDVQIFHAGTLIRDGQMLTNSGRVLGVTATGETIAQAIEKAYSVIGENGVNFKDMQYRKDIAKKSLKK